MCINIKRYHIYKIERTENVKGFPVLGRMGFMIGHNFIHTSPPLCYVDNLFSPVSWEVLFETLRRHNINKIEINRKFQGIHCIMLYMFHDMTQWSPKQHLQVLVLCFAYNWYPPVPWYNFLKHYGDIILIYRYNKQCQEITCFRLEIFHDVIQWYTHMFINVLYIQLIIFSCVMIDFIWNIRKT